MAVWMILLARKPAMLQACCSMGEGPGLGGTGATMQCVTHVQKLVDQSVTSIHVLPPSLLNWSTQVAVSRIATSQQGPALATTSLSCCIQLRACRRSAPTTAFHVAGIRSWSRHPSIILSQSLFSGGMHTRVPPVGPSSGGEMGARNDPSGSQFKSGISHGSVV